MTEEGESFISRCLDKNCLLVYKLLTHFTIFASLGNHSCKSNGPDFDLGGFTRPRPSRPTGGSRHQDEDRDSKGGRFYF